MNLGRHNKLGMKDACRQLERLGLRNVASYRQSGNFAFDADIKAPAAERVMENWLKQLLGKEIVACVRSMAELEAILDTNPFADELRSGKTYVTFLSRPPRTKPRLPLTTPGGEFRVVRLTRREAFSIRQESGGRLLEPNGFIEQRLGVEATTRTLGTVEGVVAKYAKR